MKPRLLLACAFGLGLHLALLIMLGATFTVTQAAPITLHVAHDCTGISNCYPSIQAAINAANDGDTIRVAQGTFLETVLITKSVILEGGWSLDFSARDWSLYVTTIDAQRAGSAIRVDGIVSPTIEGFSITGGNASNYLGWGGGILIAGDWDEHSLAIIRHNVITNNIACDGLVSCQGYGGGIMVYSSQSIIEHNTIISNAARTGGEGNGHGGGVAIWGWPADSTIAHNIIASNTAVFSTTGAFAAGEGGGFWSDRNTILRDNEIRANVAAVKGEGRGGGVYAGGDLHNNRILSNTASISGAGVGGGVYAYYVGDFDDNLVQGNVASQNGDGSGGGIVATYLARALHNKIVGNVATRGGGVYYNEYSGNQEFSHNLVTHNQATGTNLATFDGGGGIASAADQLEMTHNEIISNTAERTGGGLLVTQGTRYLVQDNQIANNVGYTGGGLAVYTATGTIANNRIIGNQAIAGGGVYLWGQASPALDRNVVMSNTAQGFFVAGGGLLIYVDSGTQVTLTNHLVAHNLAGASGLGGGIVCSGGGGCNIINCSIADNNQGDHQEGILLGSGAPHKVWNTIIVGHSVGITVAGGTADLDYNDYYDNAINVGGAASGAHSLTDDPQFEDRAASDYHLAMGSLLIDQGGSVNVPHDFEGDPRPRGSAIDIGADEAYLAESYVSDFTGSDTNDGSPAHPFATVTQAVSETRSGGAIYVGRGHYTERITITRSIKLLGGYQESDWARDIDAYSATLDAERQGSVIVVRGAGVSATIEGFTITGGEAHIYGSGGGLIAYDGAAVNLRLNTIWGNHAQNGGGGILLSMGDETHSESVVEANRIFDNRAEGIFVPLAGARLPLHPLQGPEPGGGLLIWGGPARIVNNWVYSNTSAAGGDGMALVNHYDPVQVYHNTIADNAGHAGVGIELRGQEFYLYNNLIIGHGTGITASADALAAWDHNGFHDNTALYGPGLAGGSHDVSGDPSFANRPAHDYHIGPGSIMAGRGLDLGVTTDVDGDPRPAPVGTLPDLGADEISQRRIYLPLVLRNH